MTLVDVPIASRQAASAKPISLDISLPSHQGHALLERANALNCGGQRPPRYEPTPIVESDTVPTDGMRQPVMRLCVLVGVWSRETRVAPRPPQKSTLSRLLRCTLHFRNGSKTRTPLRRPHFRFRQLRTCLPHWLGPLSAIGLNRSRGRVPAA